jgi:hypothetical protein
MNRNLFLTVLNTEKSKIKTVVCSMGLLVAFSHGRKTKDKRAKKKKWAHRCLVSPS